MDAMQSSVDQTKLLLTAAQAAEALELSQRTLYSLTRPRGPIPCVRLGSRLIRYCPEALMAWKQQAMEIAQQ